MKVTYRTEKLDFEFECETMQDIFKQLSKIQEVFDDLKVYWNGKVSDQSRFVVRMDDDENEYYELWYSGSDPHFFGCKKQYGSKKKPKGDVYPKYKDGEGNLLTENIYKNKGFTKFNKETSKVE